MNITVYCGVASGNDPAYRQSAVDLGTWIAQAGHTLVYGGGGVGIMGALADAVLDAGGKVVGVIPQFLVDREQLDMRLEDPIVVDTMAQRKTIMKQRADAFVMLPGGIGTFEEITEILSDEKLGHIDAPVFIANINGCYDAFLESLGQLVANGFLEPGESPFREVTSIAQIAEALDASA